MYMDCTLGNVEGVEGNSSGILKSEPS